MPPLLTLKLLEALREAARTGAVTVRCSLDLEWSQTEVAIDAAGFGHAGRHYPWPANLRDRTIYHWDGDGFRAVSRFGAGLIKLVPTEWGPPTFEIDGIKMLPTATVSPWDDAQRKVNLVQPRGKVVLDTCGGLGYFAAWCLRSQAARVLSFEKNPDVIWLRSLNPWSPVSTADTGALTLTPGDISEEITRLPDDSVDAILHDPPRFGIAGELYSQSLYDQFARVLRRKGRLFHYTGAPNQRSRGRDLAGEVAKRLRQAGFTTELNGDGVLASRGG